MDIIFQIKAIEHIFNLITGKEINKTAKFKGEKPAAANISSQLVEKVKPEQVGLSSEMLIEMLNKMAESKSANIHQLVIVKNGKLVLDTAFYPFSNGIWHVTHSACKTVTAMAVGILVTKGLLSLDKKLIDIFESETNIVSKFKLNKVTVRHLLTMTSGLTANEIMIVSENDWLRAALDSACSFEPGSRFQYNSINSYLLSAIVEKITGKTMFEFIKEELFSELSISSVFWESCPMGRTKGGWGLYMLPSDMAKLGVFMLKKGNWNGKQIISRDYIEQMTSPSVIPPKEHGLDGYGFQLWMGKREKSFVFNGMLGQNVHCFPDTETVIAVTGGDHELFGKCSVNEIINEYFAEGKAYLQEAKKGKDGDKAYKKLIKTAASLKNPSYNMDGDKGFFKRVLSFVKKEEELNAEIKLLDGKCFILEGTQLHTEPFFSRLISNSYPKGISEISFFKEGEGFYMKLKEGDVENLIPIPFDDYGICDIESNGIKYKAAVKGRFTKNEDEVKLLKISMPFLEHSNGRVFKIFFDSEDKIRVRTEEIPGRKIIEQGISGLGFMFGEKSGASLISKIDPYVIRMLSLSVTEPEVEGELKKE